MKELTEKQRETIAKQRFMDVSFMPRPIFYAMGNADDPILLAAIFSKCCDVAAFYRVQAVQRRPRESGGNDLWRDQHLP